MADPLLWHLPRPSIHEEPHRQTPCVVRKRGSPSISSRPCTLESTGSNHHNDKDDCPEANVPPVSSPLARYGVSG